MKLCFTFLAVTLFGASFAFARQSAKPQVLFSGPPQQAQPALPQPTQDSKVTDAERRAVTITAWDIDAHLAPHQQSLEAHVRVTIRNDSAAPLAEIPLQLSSTLHFESVGLDGKRLTYTTGILNSDADHSGQLVEAAIPLAEPLAPNSFLTLDVAYGGDIPLTAHRLLAIDTPQVQAEASDWDRISDDFTGLRGYGNVVWYPVASIPYLLGDGARVFTEIGRQKLLDQNATVALRITDEFLDQPPNAALLDGHFASLDKPTSMPTGSFPGVITASLPTRPLGFEVPSIFLARRTEISDNGIRIFTTDADSPNAKNYTAAAAQVAPLIKTWFANKSNALATILDLPEPNDVPAE
ncbi:MAG TPA: hypothetical protein VK819_17365, partial [Acidobacteriaceae bacterium]|nr:hypothetical protein [Acidobacteriaceae bacterium]